MLKGLLISEERSVLVNDMITKFRKEPIEYNDRTCIIVIDIQEISIGLIVDNVAEATTI